MITHDIHQVFSRDTGFCVSTMGHAHVETDQGIHNPFRHVILRFCGGLAFLFAVFACGTACEKKFLNFF